MTRITALKSIFVALAVVLAVAACGGNGNSPSVAGSGATTTNASNSNAPSGSNSSGGGPARGGSLTMVGGNAEQMRKFASCMRSHGEPSFPDPSASGAISIHGVNPDSPAFKKAQEACKKYAPNGGQAPSPAQQAAAQAAALRFSACMRAHGLPKFPDPQFSNGRASLQVGKNGGIDPQSPTFQAAQKACAKNLPGMVQSQKATP